MKKKPKRAVDIILPGLKLRSTLRGHKGQVTRIVWSPDGRRLATAGTDSYIRLWDVLTGELVYTIGGHFREVLGVAWSPDAQTLATSSGDRSIQLKDLLTGKLRQSIEGHSSSIYSLAWSPDGKTLASGSGDYTIRLWNMEMIESLQITKLLRIFSGNGPVYSLAWSPDGKHLASGGGQLHIWNWETGEHHKALLGHSDTVFDIAWSPDGKMLASGSRDKTIRLWDAKDGHQLHILKGHTDGINSLSFSSNGDFLASRSRDNSIFLWRCENFETVVSFEEDGEPGVWLGGIAFHPNKAILATLAKNNNVIKIWDVDFNALLGAPTVIPSVHYTNAKVVLVGETSTGKTCLALALMGKPFEPQESTHGIKVWTFCSETVGRPGGGQIIRETLLWDLAGQTDYQVVHQLFLDETALGIILFDPTHPENPFGGVGHWEKALKRVVGVECPQLLVAGRVDRGHPTATARDIETFRCEHGFMEFIATSAKTNEGIEKLHEAIARAIPWGKLPVTSSPELWKDIREYLLQRRDGEEVLTRRSDLREAFRRGRPQAKFTGAEFDTVISHAQVQGLVWRLSFGDFVLLKPELLNDYASGVVRVARKHEEGLGCVKERDVLDARIDFEDLNRITDAEIERSLLHAVVALFLSREVALREGEYLVFPSRFNRKRPEYPKPPLREVAYSFAGPIEDIYATLVVRLYYCGAFELRDLWKNAAEFRDPVGRICGFVLHSPDEGHGVISIFFEENVSVDSKVLLLRFIHEHLNKRALLGSLMRERIYRCPACGEEVENRRAVEIRLKKGEKTILCQYCEKQILLVDLLEEKFGDPELLRQVRELEKEAEERKEQAVGVTTAKAKEDIGEFDVFLAYNTEDIHQVETIGEALRRRGLNPWLDKWNLRPGRMFQEEIERVLPSIKSIAVCVGPTGIGPWEQMEMRMAINQFVKKKLPVIPLLLPGVQKKPELPLLLQEFSWVDFHKGADDHEALDNFEFGITGEHPQRKVK